MVTRAIKAKWSIGERKFWEDFRTKERERNRENTIKIFKINIGTVQEHGYISIGRGLNLLTLEQGSEKTVRKKHWKKMIK